MITKEISRANNPSILSHTSKKNSNLQTVRVKKNPGLVSTHIESEITTIKTYIGDITETAGTAKFQ